MFGADMDDYLAKQVKQKDLVATIAKWNSSQSIPHEQKEPVSSETREPGRDCVDAMVLDELRQLDASCNLLSTLIAHFLEKFPTRLAALQDAFQHGDGQALARAAHELNGASGNLGAQKMRQLSVKLQALGKANDLAKARSLLAQLASEFELVHHRLKAEQAIILHHTVSDEA
jgi:HPt (histidine-containing phosphotransfer) domain-containing protein